MLHVFMAENRAELVRRCRERVQLRGTWPPPEPTQGIPAILEQVIATLIDEADADVFDEGASWLAITSAASRHGATMSRRGLTVGEVVHEYGDVCQSVTALAILLNAPVSVAELRTLNRCLDVAIAGAVTEFNAGTFQTAEQRIQASLLAVRQQATRLREERALRERFVTTISHDLRSPLSAVKMAAYLLLQQTSATPRTSKLADLVSRNVDHADRMIVDLLDVNRLQVGQPLTVQLERCNMNELVSDALKAVDALHGPRFIVESDAPIEGLWSRSGLRRIVENLCTHAIKHGATNRPVKIAMRSDHAHAMLEVHHEGPAVSAEEEATLRMLTLVRGITAAHGGRVEIDSSEDRGTTYRVTLPLDARPWVREPDDQRAACTLGSCSSLSRST